MGLSKAGVPVDQQGVVVLGRVLRHGDGGGIGQLVGGAHHEGLKRELRGGESLALAVGTAIVQLRIVQIVQDLHLEICGEDIMEGGFDVFHEQGFDISLFEVVGTVEEKRIALDVHGLQFVEPGGNGGLRELALQLGKHIVPYIGDGIQKETPLSSKKIDKAVQFIIPKKGANYNTYSNNKNRPGRAVPATRYCG